MKRATKSTKVVRASRVKKAVVRKSKDQAVRSFVTGFYKEHGGVMSRLAHE